MNKIALKILYPVFIIFIVLSGCDFLIDYGPTYFTIQVDSISAPDSVRTTDTLSIGFHGTVGNTACMHFWDIQNTLKNNQLDVTLWGFEEYTYRNTHCVTQTVTLDNVNYRTTNLSPGIFTIIVHQKNGTTLIKTVQVTN